MTVESKHREPWTEPGFRPTPLAPRPAAKSDVVREIQTLIGCQLQTAKSIYRLANMPPGTSGLVGQKKAALKATMTQDQAATLVAAARERIALIDGDEDG